MKITPQHEQYGLPHKEARKLPSPSDVADLLGGTRILPGMMRRADWGGPDGHHTIIEDPDGTGVWDFHKPAEGPGNSNFIPSGGGH